MKKIREFLEDKAVDFSGCKCKAIIRPYNSGRIYMQLVDIEDGMPVARVTLDIDTLPIIDDMIIIKSYSENKGMYEALLSSGIIKPCERVYAVGFEFAKICFLNM